MRRNRRLIGDDSGSTLAIVLIVTIVVLITVMAMMQLGAQDAVLAVRDVRVSQAFYCAEAGAERGEAWLIGQSSPPSSQTNPFGDTPESFGGGLSRVLIKPYSLGIRTAYTVTSYATVDGHSRAVEVDVTPISLTDYLYYINRDLGDFSPGYFKTGDVIDGPIHINDELAIWGNPVFTDEVRTTASTIYYNNGGTPTSLCSTSNPPYDQPDFQESCTFGASHLNWIDNKDIAALDALADISLGGSWEIVFGRDAGSGPMLGWVSMRKVGVTAWTDVQIPPEGLIISTGGDAHVSGIVDGQVTVCAGGYLGITDDILYADSDASGPREGCDDILGLVANTKVFIEDNVPNGSDCVVHAHVMAINNNAALVENHDLGLPRGTLTLYGGVAQDKWGPVGTGYYDAYGEFHVLTGYERDFHYDWRLRDMLPPGYSAIAFPGGGLARLAWREITPLDLEDWGG